MLNWLLIIGLAIALVPVTCVNKQDDICIGTFNAKRLGKKKMSDPFVVDILVQIISRYDILLLVEVQDSKHEHFPKLVETVARKSQKPYTYIVSDRLGRSTYKEQYLYVYRSDIFEIADSYHFDDGDEEKGDDLFEREPFIVKFKSQYTDPSEFAIAAIHTPPDEAAEEMVDLIHVYNDVTTRLKTPHVIVMGDFNAACRYVRKSDWDNIELHTDEKFLWLVPHDEDTTVGDSYCAYDRIVLAGDRMKANVVPDSAKTFRFDEHLALGMDDAKRVSDHYPVEFKMKRQLAEPAGSYSSSPGEL